MTNIGLDLGNTRTKMTIDNKHAAIPSLYAYDKPVIVNGSGRELRVKAFKLLFDDTWLWFGQDVLASQSVIHKIDEAKFDDKHISILFRAVLYEWSNKHNISLSNLGKLTIVASLPPGLYQQSKLGLKAEKAYKKAFNRRQSHVKMRDGKHTIQIVTNFHSLVRETVTYGARS